MKITSFDRNTVKNLRSDIDSALAILSKKYGIEIRISLFYTIVNFKW